MTERVWVIPKARSRHTQETYHTDPECRCVGPHHVEKDKAVIHDDREECTFCAGTNTTSNECHRRALRDMIATGEVDV